MKMKPEQLLPAEISYLQAVVRWLGKRLPDDVNESIDASRLEKALRNRVRGLAIAEAQRPGHTDGWREKGKVKPAILTPSGPPLGPSPLFGSQFVKPPLRFLW
jgi:hypothetical protein